MATIVITSKSAGLFTKTVGVISADYPRVYYAFEAADGNIRAEMEGEEKSDLFTPIHYSEIEIDGVVYASANETVSKLNEVIYNKASGGSASDTVEAKALFQKVVKLDTTNTTLTLPSQTISYLDAVIIDTAGTGKIDIQDGSNDIVTIKTDGLYKYERHFNDFTNNTNPHDIVITFSGVDSGYLLVEYSNY